MKYLGVPLTIKELSVAQWPPLIEKVVAKLNAWTNLFLSYAGRLQLLE